MELRLPATTLGAATPLLQPFSKLRRVDGSAIPATVLVADGTAWLRVVPDLPRITAVTAYLGPAEGDGSFSVGADRLIDMAKRAHDELTVTEEYDIVTVGPWQTPAVEAGQLPDVGEPAATVSLKGFLAGLASVKIAASTDLVRPRLNIVHFAHGFARACDGMRYREERVPFDEEWDVSVFLAPMLDRYFGSIESTDLVLSRSASHQGYTAAGVQVIAPLPTAQYLDLDELVAAPARANNNFLLKVDRAALIQAVRDAAIMSGENSVVTLDVSVDSLVVSASDGTDNRARVDLACEWAGEARTLRFYVEPLLQLLRASERDLVELRLGTSTLRQLTSVVVWEDTRFALLNQVRMEG
jgi:hypothetical protein